MIFLLGLGAAANAGFLLPEELPAERRFRNFDRAVQATVKIAESEGGDCASEFVSRDGYLVTAMHCLARCLHAAGLNEASSEKLQLTPKLTLFRNDLGKLPVTCRLAIDGEWQPARIVAIGKGVVIYPGVLGADRKEMLELEELEIEGYGDSANDFAVVKLNRRSPCVPIANKPPKRGEPAWILGFPIKTRRSREDSDGFSKYVSTGEFCSKVDSSRALLDGLELEQFSERIRESLAGYPNRDVFVADYLSLEEASAWEATTVDTIHGMSGGGVYDAEGKLTGVHIQGRTYKKGFSKKRSESPFGSERYIPIQVIRTLVAERLGEAQAKAIFSCE